MVLLIHISITLKNIELTSPLKNVQYRGPNSKKELKTFLKRFLTKAQKLEKNSEKSVLFTKYKYAGTK